MRTLDPERLVDSGRHWYISDGPPLRRGSIFTERLICERQIDVGLTLYQSQSL